MMKVTTVNGLITIKATAVEGIEGAFSGEGAKTVIPAKVTGKFSIRLVPDMEPAKVDKIVMDHLNALWKTRGSPNHFQ